MLCSIELEPPILAESFLLAIVKHRKPMYSTFRYERTNTKIAAWQSTLHVGQVANNVAL